MTFRYFFVAEKFYAGEVSIKYCPTDNMMGDSFTKPLKGLKFQKVQRYYPKLTGW